LFTKKDYYFVVLEYYDEVRSKINWSIEKSPQDGWFHLRFHHGDYALYLKSCGNDEVVFTKGFDNKDRFQYYENMIFDRDGLVLTKDPLRFEKINEDEEERYDQIFEIEK
jgi:hypothetical protein